MAKLTKETFGHMLPAAWIAATGQPNLPGKDELIDLLIRNQDEIPPSIVDLLQVEHRLDGPVLREYATFIASAQGGGLVSRDNPSNISARAKIDRMQAQDLVDQWSVEFPQEVEWLIKVIRRFKTAKNRS